MDWVRFLDENNIHYVTRGPNTKRGEVSIQCPMCGDEDPSEHLGINLGSENWGCHRETSHRGKSSRTLVKAILHCSSQQAGLLVKQYSHSDPDTLEAALASLEETENHTLAEQVRNQEILPQFEDFSHIKPRGITKRFFKYLERRGCDDPSSLITRYGLKCAIAGRYKDRIIVPVRHSGELLGWTSRAITETVNAPRYLASSTEVKTTVWNYDALKAGGERLIVVEGPFDAIKVDNHNFTVTKDTDIEFRATCTFGTSPTISQIAVLRALAKGFNEVWVLFDRGADGPGADLAEWIGAKQAYLPMGIDDPGELKKTHLAYLGEKDFSGYFNLHDTLVRAPYLTLMLRNNVLLQDMINKRKQNMIRRRRGT